MPGQTAALLDPLLVLGIPGPWKSWEELVVHAVKRTDGRFIVAGRVLYEVEERRGFRLEFRPRNERMREAFCSTSGASR